MREKLHMTPEQIEIFLRQSNPTAKQAKIINRWRVSFIKLAQDFTQNTPMSGDAVVALRALKSAMQAMQIALISPMPKPDPNG